MLDFSFALTALKLGKSVTRSGWNGKGMYLTLQVPDANSKMTRPYIYMTIPAGSSSQFADGDAHDHRIPWLASQTDLLSEDWEILEE